MVRKAVGAVYAMCVLVTVFSQSGVAATGDIVLYATDAVNIHGNWARVSDTTAAGGQKMVSADYGWSDTSAPLSSPTDAFDVTFTAPSATTYHLWLRLRATSNSKYNDSVFVQASDAVDSNGAALYALGTTTGLTVNLATDATGKSLSGWGWQDRAYWLTQPTTFRFASTGSHTLRIQTREDGVQIDQVVLSPVTYLTTAPGPVSNDTTIVPKTVVSTTAALPSPWTNQDVGTTGLAGSTSLTSGTFSVAGSGADIGGTADAFQFASQPVTGDTQIIARVTSLQNTNAYAKAGVMLRESTAAGAAHVLLDVRPNGAIEFLTRSATGASTTFIAGSTQPTPAWLKLTRNGGTVTGSISSTGATWTVAGTTSVTMSTGLIGLAVTSHDTTLPNTATFDNVLVGLPPTVPSAPVPAAGATGVGTVVSFTWTATGATTYDLNFGTANPPPSAATGLTTAAFTPATLANGTTYFWQVIARNAAGVTPGPIWSVTTMVAAPTTPVPLTPATGATGVTIPATLTWSAATATSYDVSFGTTNPPPAAVTGLTVASFVPASQANGTTYYWQITARNASGGTVGPVSAFTTVVAAPGVPTAIVPANAATGVALPPTLTWSAANATSYDVSFGTTNPPSAAATGLSAATYTPASLAPVTTYYWQVTARNAGGATSGAVWSFVTGGVPSPWQGQDVGAVGLAGSASDTTGTFTVSGAGADIWGTADGFNFVSQTVNGDIRVVARVVSLQNTNAYAKAGVMLRESLAAGAGHVILDVRPNGSVEFMTRSATGGTTAFLAGGTQPMPAWLQLTRSGSTVTAATSADATTWTTIGATSVTMSTSAYLGLAVTSHDTTVRTTAVFDTVAVTVPASTTTSTTTTTSSTTTSTASTTTSGAPTAYSAITNRTTYPKPAVPPLGAAGFTFGDPTFGSTIVRVTDGNTRPGLVNRSYRVPSNAHLAAWNASSTAFFVVSNDGTSIPYAFNPTTRTTSRVAPVSTGNGGLTLAFYVEPQFSLVSPNVIYGAVSGSNNRTIGEYDFSTGAYTTVVNLDTLVGGLSGTYIGGVMTGGNPTENLMTFFGGASQDAHYYLLWAPVGNVGAAKVVNTVTSTINGVSASVVLNFHLHSAQIDKSGRYVFLYPTAGDLATPRSASQAYVWDTATDAITAITSRMLGGGHDASGYGYWVNQDCCTSSSWDAAQWQFRSLANLAATSDVIVPVLSPQEVYLADHTTWNNAQPATLVPVISSTYRYGNNTAAWRAWDDEILGIDTTGGTGLVWRFAHHRSNVGSDANPAQPYFWYEPIANVSPDGRWVLFTSNWEKTLGTDAAEGTYRQDVFLVQLAPQ